MNVLEFLQALLETGRVSVALSENKTGRQDLTPILLDFDRSARLNLAGSAPKLDLAVAEWAATVLYRGCQLAVLRNVDAGEVAAAFQSPYPSPRSPETDYSADLFFQYLPDLQAITKRLAADDPLVAQLVALASAWPLSCGTMEGGTLGSTDSFFQHPSLRQLYVDRILERKALHLVQEPEIAELIRAAYGPFPALCTEFAEAIEGRTASPL